MRTTLHQISPRRTLASKTALHISLMAATLILPFITCAGQPPTKAHPRYKLIDLGTFGGPSSGIVSFGLQLINNQGTAIGAADTPIADPFDPNCFNVSCFVQHAFQWKNGVLTDLGALPGGGSSAASWINERGQIVGV